ncbi:MAG: hypothetical protein JNK02_15785 [Planctomycetes bacterium]|nr:hypothetical protein [Planctomycetota bacterium]
MTSAAAFDLPRLALAAAVAALALALFVRLAPRTGFQDDGSDAPARKHQARAVPLAGGPALWIAALALLASGAPLAAEPAQASRAAGFAFEPGALAAGALLAFATGLLDDRLARGLGPLEKLAGQTLAGLALCAGLWVAGQPAEPWERALALCAAVAAQNVANTYDHADGMLGGAALSGLLAARASLAGAVAAFLLANLTRPTRGGPPRAFLGDSGSHLLGVVLLASPGGAAALLIPALDLARVVVLRVRAGEPFWRGDRRHLGQRLTEAGRGPLAAAALALLAAAPAFGALAAAEAGLLERGPALLSGVAGCALLLALLLRLHPPRTAT